MINKDQNIPDLYLEQFVFNELSQSKRDEIAELLKDDKTLAKRIENIRVSNTKFNEKNTLSLSISRIEIKEQESKIKQTPQLAQWQYASISSVFLIILLFTIPQENDISIKHINNTINESNDTIRLKGITPELHIFRKTIDNIELISSQQDVKENDILQIRYQGAGYQYGIIFSIDGAGELTLHYPNSASDNTDIEPQGDIALPFAYQLNNAPEFERFFLVTSNKKLNIQDIITQGKSIASHKDRNIATLDLSNNYYQTSILLSKAK